MHKLACFALVLITLAAPPPVLGAKRLGPPIAELQSAPERIRVVVAEAREKPEANKILFVISQQLSGTSPDEVLLRTDARTFADVQNGRSYVVAWTDQRRSEHPAKRWEEDPEGPTTVQAAGVGVTTVFDDTPELRFLFTPATAEKTALAKEQLEALLAQLQRKDIRSRGLVVTELFLRDDLTDIMDPAQVGILRQVLEDPQLEPQHRDFLLRSALRLSADATAPWLAEEFRRIIILNGTQYDLASFVPGLVRTAARGLQQAGERADIELLGNLLYANNPGVSKAALASMERFDPQMTADKARKALERGWIHGETRLALQRYLAQTPR